LLLCYLSPQLCAAAGAIPGRVTVRTTRAVEHAPSATTSATETIAKATAMLTPVVIRCARVVWSAHQGTRRPVASPGAMFTPVASRLNVAPAASAPRLPRGAKAGAMLMCALRCPIPGGMRSVNMLCDSDTNLLDHAHRRAI
jgi:hypothetical protein